MEFDPNNLATFIEINDQASLDLFRLDDRSLVHSDVKCIVLFVVSHPLLGPTVNESVPLAFDGSDRRTPRRAGA